MTFTRERRIAVYLLVFVAILAVVGASTLQTVDAKGRTKTKTTLSISKRVDIQTDNCENAGGEISVSYGYESDGSESATTSCSGGLLDGNNCINEETTMECWQSGRVLPPSHLDGTVPLVPITDVQVVQPVPTRNVPVGALDDSPTLVSDGFDVTDAGAGGQAGDGSVVDNPVVDTGTVQVVDQPVTVPDSPSMPVLLPLD